MKEARTLAFNTSLGRTIGLPEHNGEKYKNSGKEDSNNGMVSDGNEKVGSWELSSRSEMSYVLQY